MVCEQVDGPMRYVLLIYLDEAPFAAMTEAQRLGYIPAMAQYDAEIAQSGNFELGAALRHPNEAATVRVRQGRLSAIDGPFAETKEHLAGFIIIEARDLVDAIRLAGAMPLANVGSVEVRPIKNHPGEE
jgi:hypothetical protein